MRLRAVALALLFAAPLAAAGPEFQVPNSTAGNQYFPAVAVSDNGTFVIVWGVESTTVIYARRFNSSGAAIAAEFEVGTTPLVDDYIPAVGADADGDFVVVWESWPDLTTAYNVKMQRYSSAGSPLGVETVVNTTVTGDQRAPSVAMNATGDYVVAWVDIAGSDGDQRGIYAQRFSSAGSPIGAEILVNATTTGDQRYPSVAIAGDGSFVVTFDSTVSVSIVGRRFNSSGVAIGGEFAVSTSPPEQTYSHVAMNSAGAFVVAWAGDVQDGSDYGVIVRRFNSSGAALGGEMVVNTYITERQALNSVGIDADGNFVVAWTSYKQDDPANYGIFSQRFNSSGAAIAVEFQVNESTAGSQTFNRVGSGNGQGGGNNLSMNASGAFVVTWDSDGQDGSGNGVFASLSTPEPTATPAATAVPPTATATITLTPSITTTPIPRYPISSRSAS